MGTTHGLALVDTDRNDVIETVTTTRQLLSESSSPAVFHPLFFSLLLSPEMADPTFTGGFRRSGKEGKKFFRKVPKFFRVRKTSTDPGAASPE